MKFASYFLVFLLVSGCSFAGSGSGGTVERLELEGKPYFDHIVATGEFESLLDEMEGGDEVSIRASSLMAGWADASTALSLRFALSRALVRNPDAVLGLVPGVFSASDLCTIPYIEESMEVELRHVDESISALERSATSGGAHGECMAIYMSIREEMAGGAGGR